MRSDVHAPAERDALAADFGWTDGGRSFAETDGDRLFENFPRLARLERPRSQS